MHTRKETTQNHVTSLLARFKTFPLLILFPSRPGLGGFGAHLLVVLLEGGQVFSGLAELPLLHSFSDVPVHEGALGVHEIELVIDAAKRLGDGGGVGDHAHGPLHGGQVSARDLRGGLVVDPALEAGGAPVDELDGALGLDGGDGRVHVLGDDVPAVHEAAGHVLAVARIALGEEVRRLEDRVGDFRHRHGLVEGLMCNKSVSNVGLRSASLNSCRLDECM
jgi:hypothetical protein